MFCNKTYLHVWKKQRKEAFVVWWWSENNTMTGVVQHMFCTVHVTRWWWLSFRGIACEGHTHTHTQTQSRLSSLKFALQTKTGQLQYNTSLIWFVLCVWTCSQHVHPLVNVHMYSAHLLHTSRNKLMTQFSLRLFLLPLGQFNLVHAVFWCDHTTGC